MDATTQLALRAIIKGLRDSEALSEPQVEKIIGALHEAEESEKRQHHGCVAYDLMKLATDIRSDIPARQ